jgi:hypothetical protein
MTNLIKSWNNRTIRIRNDRYVSLTDMAQACGKRFHDWNRLESAKSYLEALSGSAQIPADQLVQVNESEGSNEQRGTWGHPKLAIRFAQWCSDEFAVQVDCWIDELMTTGKVELQSVQPPIAPLSLPPADIRITNLHSALTGFGIDLTNPRYKQAIQDLVVDKILNEQASLPGSTETWLGVAEKAERLGYSPSLVAQFRSSLGRYVSQGSSTLEARTENRLCNGTMRQIRLYLDCDELTELVTEFMDAKVLKSAQYDRD